MSSVYTVASFRDSYGEATVSIPALTDLKADDQVKPPCLDAQKNGKRKLGRGEKEDDAYKKKSAVRRCSRYRAPGHTVTTCSGLAAEPIDAVPRDQFAQQMAFHGVNPLHAELSEVQLQNLILRASLQDMLHAKHKLLLFPSLLPLLTSGNTPLTLSHHCSQTKHL